MGLGLNSTPEEMMRAIQESMKPASQEAAEGQQLLNQTFNRFATSPDPEANAVDAEMTRKHGLGWRALDGVMLVLQEISRPQKALFAGFNHWQKGGSLSQAWDVTQDEYTWGWGTGNFRRDITGQNILDPKGKRGAAHSLLSVEGAAGFVLDVVIDPVNLIPAAPIVRAVGRGGGRAARLLGSAADQTKLTGKIKDSLVDGWKKTFIRPTYTEDASRAAVEARTRLDAYANEYREVILDDIITDNNAWRTLATEAGFKNVDELGAFVNETAATTKIRDASMGLAEPLNDTMARIYRDYGVDQYDQFMRTAGFRALADEAPLRRAIFNSEFDKAMAAANRTFPQGVSDDLKNVIFELKERDLERFVTETTKTVAPSGRTLPVFESMQRDYMMLSATREFRDFLSTMSLGKVTKGSATSAADYSPFHVSEIHSQLQEIGADAANRLLRTESKEFPGLSEFVLVHPKSGMRMHLPLMEQGFHTDPRLIDATRQYYTDLAVNRSQVLGDLVDGYGKKLDEFMEVQVIDRSTGQQVLDRLGNPVFKTVNTFQRGPEVINPAAVKSRTTQSIIGKFGHKLSEVEELTRLTPEAAYQLERDGFKILHDIPGFENVALPAEAADIVQNTMQWSSGSFDAVPGLKALSKLQNEVWKPLTLFPFPGYYARNTVTNVFLQNNMGMNVVKDIVPYTARGTKILMAGSHPNAFRRIKEATTRVAGKGTGVKHRQLFEAATAHPSIVTRGAADPTLAEKATRLKDLVDGVTLEQLGNKDELGLLQLFTDLGVVRGGSYGSSEIFRNLEQIAETAVKHPLRRLMGFTVNTNAGLASGANMAMMAEDAQRVGAMLWGLENGVPVEASDLATRLIKGAPERTKDILAVRDYVMKHMVDFNALTDIEKNVFRKYAIPFYSWARHATPLAAESFVMDNIKWRAMNKIIQQQEKNMVEHDQMLPDRMIPEYVARGLHVPTSRDTNGDYRFFLFDGWIPASQLTDIDSWEELLKAPLEQSGPVLKTLIELATQESLFLERDFAIGNRTYLGHRIPEWGITLLRNVRILNTVDSLMKAEDRDEQIDQLLRFFTGFNTVRVQRGRAAMAYKSKVDKMRQKITSDIMNAAREGHREEIPALIEQLKEFINEGR